MIGDSAALRYAAVVGRSPPEGAFGAENEAVRDIGINAAAAPQPHLDLLAPSECQLADARVAFDAEAAKALSIGLRGDQAK